MSNTTDDNVISNELKDIKKDIEKITLDPDKVALNDLIKISMSIRDNLPKIVTAIVIVATYVAYSYNFKENTNEKLQEIKKDIEDIKKDLAESKSKLSLIAVHEAEINDIKNYNNLNNKTLELENKINSLVGTKKSKK